MHILKIFSLKSVFNRLYRLSPNGHQLSDGEIKKLQKCLLCIYSDIYEVCKKYEIKPFLQGGTLLGKLRHNGFIPWDDDLDLGMSRADYEKFKKIFEHELGEKYILKGPGCLNGATNRFIQIFSKKTYYKTIGMPDSIPHHVYIDIFPIDYVPEKKINRFFKGMWCNSLLAAAGCVEFRDTITKEIQKLMCSSFCGWFNMKLRLTLGWMLSFMSLEEWYRKIDKALIVEQETKYCTSGTGRKHYHGETVNTDVFFPLKYSEFEGYPAWIPNQSEYYLKNLYGNYMEIPDENDREQHFIEELKIEIE